MGSRARSLCGLCRILVLVCIGALNGGSPSDLGAQPARQVLPAGAGIARRLTGGEVHAYGIQASPGARRLITVEQRGIDVEVAVLRPDGTALIAVDGPTDSEGPETLLLPVDASGRLEVKIGSPSPGVAPGTYTVRMEDLAESTPAERRRIDAERLMTEAAARNREGKAESLRLAAVRYGEARVRWRSLGNRREEARCALSAGGIHMSLGEPKEALEDYRQALALAVARGDAPGQAAA